MVATTCDKVQQYLNPEAEYWLDWFHITMRITVMKQMAKGLAKETKPAANTEGEPARQPESKNIEKELQSLKWNLWHGNVERWNGSRTCSGTWSSAWGDRRTKVSY